jgi:hypothetical protein
MKFVAQMRFNAGDYFLAGGFDSYDKAEEWAKQYIEGTPGCVSYTILQIIPHR